MQLSNIYTIPCVHVLVSMQATMVLSWRWGWIMPLQRTAACGVRFAPQRGMCTCKDLSNILYGTWVSMFISLPLVILLCVFLIRWDMSIEESLYTEKKASSLSTWREKSHFANKPCHQHLGSIHPPLLNIELTKVVVDELHLLLRVMDVLIWNLISLAASRDHKEQCQGETSNHIRQLEQAVQSCKVTFTIWQCVDGDSRLQPGKYDCTSLNGTDRLRVLCIFPAKFDTILPGDLAVPMPQLWNVSVISECVLHFFKEHVA